MNMSRTTRVLGFSVPPTVVKEVEFLAKEERRTKSELFREMVRVYRRYRDQRERDEERWVTNLIQEAKAEQAQKPMSVEEMLKESDRLARSGAKQAKKLGLKAKDVNRLIHDFRAQKQS
jgi:metal-responsive CopG/Arc/MetJ family transcriptional regulator